ncbi:hypothetical protein QMY03_08840 [Arthrobacter sp. KFRI-F3372]|nr:hypothetical protein QMY03_08840 [Arthrobacter sp. KFRI-F3372]
MSGKRDTTTGLEIGLSKVLDPIHGEINMEDEYSPDGRHILMELVFSPSMQRLRRVKQLGFVSRQYSGADHSRFSHALGTMHVMRKLLTHLDGPTADNLQGVESELKQNPELDDAEPDIFGRASVRQHMLVASLLQDLGELPYGQASDGILRPTEDVCREVSAYVNEDVHAWPPKAVFSLAAIFGELKPTLAALGLTCLAYLITGKHWANPKPHLHAAMQMLDGIVDADRIDYVARDAHHTGVGQVNIDQVISSLRYYDVQGPVCRDAGPVASLLALRAHLYSTVYRSAANRFRVMTLRELLLSIDANPAVCGTITGMSNLQLTFAEFLITDDVRVEAWIHAASGPEPARALPKRAGHAAALLAGTRDSYRHRWLSADVPADGQDIAIVIPPDEVFAEVFPDEPVSSTELVRIQTESEEPLELSRFNGPYAVAATNPKSTLPMHGNILLCEPHQTRSLFPVKYRNALKDGTLGASLRYQAQHQLNVPRPDTRNIEGFQGPSLFISYCAEDFKLVELIIKRLELRKQRYFALSGTFTGLGGTPGDNSRAAVRNTDACLQVASAAYLKRYRDRPDGNIALELTEIHDRRVKEIYPVVTVSPDPFTELLSGPWHLFDMTEPPFIGSPLSTSDVASIDAALIEALNAINAALQKRRAGG